MDPVSAVPVAGSAGIPAAPRTPASSLPSAGQSQTAAPPPAGSSPLHTPLAAPARTVPRLSSLRPLPILAEDLLMPDFCSGPAGLSGRSMRDYLSGALIPAQIVRVQCVIVRIVNSTETISRTAPVAFRGVVVNNIEYHLDSGAMESRYH